MLVSAESGKKGGKVFLEGRGKGNVHKRNTWVVKWEAVQAWRELTTTAPLVNKMVGGGSRGCGGRGGATSDLGVSQIRGGDSQYGTAY